MKVTLKEPLTAEQRKLVAEIERVDTLRSVLGAPIPLGTGEPVVEDLGRPRVAEMERQDIQRLAVLGYALERRLMELEEAK